MNWRFDEQVANEVIKAIIARLRTKYPTYDVYADDEVCNYLGDDIISFGAQFIVAKDGTIKASQYVGIQFLIEYHDLTRFWINVSGTLDKILKEFKLKKQEIPYRGVTFGPCAADFKWYNV